MDLRQMRQCVAVAEELHFGRAALRLNMAQCESRLVERSSFVAAVAANSPLARCKSGGLAELAQQPFILPPSKYTERSEALNLFKSVGVVPRVEQEASQTNTTLSLVGAGLGCSIVMATAVLQVIRNVMFLPIRDELPQARREMAIAWHPDYLSLETRSFLDLVTDHVTSNPGLLDLDAYRKWL